MTLAKIWRHTNFINIYIKCLWTYSPTKKWANTIHDTIQTSEFFWAFYGLEKKNVALPNMEVIKFESIIIVISVRFGYHLFSFVCLYVIYLLLKYAM